MIESSCKYFQNAMNMQNKYILWFLIERLLVIPYFTDKGEFTNKTHTHSGNLAYFDICLLHFI